LLAKAIFRRFSELAMLLPVFQDLIKPQWRKVLEELKRSGGLSISELARRVDASYMAVKQQCEELKKLGYLCRTRVPRTVVGRPEISYRLSTKADELFPQAGPEFTLELLDELKSLYGDSLPDKLLFQYFEKQAASLRKRLEKTDSFEERVIKLAALRVRDGCFGECKRNGDGRFEIEEYHNPLHGIFQVYPRAVGMEVRMLEQVIGARVARREIAAGVDIPPRVVFEIHAS
jgi:predicted ArsR family transcriptional regulator